MLMIHRQIYEKIVEFYICLKKKIDLQIQLASAKIL